MHLLYHVLYPRCCIKQDTYINLKRDIAHQTISVPRISSVRGGKKRDDDQNISGADPIHWTSVSMIDGDRGLPLTTSSPSLPAVPLIARV